MLRYLDGSASAEEAAELSVRLEADPRLRREFAALLVQCVHLSEIGREAKEAPARARAAPRSRGRLAARRGGPAAAAPGLWIGGGLAAAAALLVIVVFSVPGERSRPRAGRTIEGRAPEAPPADAERLRVATAPSAGPAERSSPPAAAEPGGAPDLPRSRVAVAPSAGPGGPSAQSHEPAPPGPAPLRPAREVGAGPAGDVAVAPAPAAGGTLARGSSVAELASAAGEVEFARAGSGRWLGARAGTPLQLGDRLRTRFSRARVELDSGSLLFVNRFTTLSLGEEARPPGLSMVGGEVYVETVPADRGLTVETPHGRAAARGTRFAVEVRPAGTTVLVVEGAVEISTADGAGLLGANQEALLARRTGPPGRAREAHDVDRRLAWTGRFGRTTERAEAHVNLAAATTLGGGRWKVTSPSSVHVTALETDNNFFLFGGGSWRDYRVSARCRLEETGAGGPYGVGIVGYWLDGRRMLRLRNLRSSWFISLGYGPRNERNLVRAAGEVDVGSEVRMVLEVRTSDGGTLVRAKFWPASGAEPAGWLLEHSAAGEPVPRAGRAGLWVCRCRASFFDIDVTPLGRAGGPR
jgi:ferric-dicitrate binding protein FerR (iron transport regulator)